MSNLESQIYGKVLFIIIMYQYLALGFDKRAKHYTTANAIQLALFTYCKLYANFCNKNTGLANMHNHLYCISKNTLNLSF